MEEHQHQINNAVLAALSPGPLQSQAYEFLQNVKSQAAEAWPACLACFLKGRATDGGRWEYEFGGQTRLFALQVVDVALSPRLKDPKEAQEVAARCEPVRQQLVDHVEREYVHGDGEGSLVYLRNKVVQTFFVLFANTYMTTWPDFFSYFASLLRRHPPSTPASDAFNPRTTDLFLRVLHEVSVEISDADLRLNKEGSRLHLDAQLRDAVRERDAARIAQDTFAIVASALQGLEPLDATSQVGLVGRRAVDCLEMGVRVVADYVPWIDISLIVTPQWIPFLYQALRLPHAGARIGAAEAILATVTKGMPPDNRLQLYSILGLTDVFAVLLAERKAAKQNAATAFDDDDEGAFYEKMAKVLNGMGVELCKICDEAAATDAAKATALAAAQQLLPLLLDMLNDPYWAVTFAVLPFASALLTRYKKEKKTSPQTHLTAEKRAFLSRLLEIVILKMKYPPDDEFEWDTVAGPGEEDDDDVVTWRERRNALKVVMDAVAWVDEELFRNATGTMITSVVDGLEAGGASVQALDWQQVELAVHVLYLYGEAIKPTTPAGLPAFVAVPVAEVKRAQKDRDYKVDYSAYPLSPLGEMMTRVCRSTIPSYPHPSVPLLWFECVVRYHDFFTVSPDVIPAVLPAFLDQRGVHQEKLNVRARCFYLFFRFVTQGRSSLAPHINQQLVRGIFERLQDVLVIDANVRAPDSPHDGGLDFLTKLSRTPSIFDSQLYLYETIGVLTSMLGQDVSQQTAILHSILTPLVEGMRAHVRTEMRSVDDLKAILMVHHFILAIGSVAKGFPDLSTRDAKPSGKWAEEFKVATDAILSVTKTLAGLQVVRDAARASFNKIIATIGTDALPHVPVLIDCLLSQMTRTELVDFLAFVGQLIHKYKTQFPPLLDDLLWPVLTRVYDSLAQPITGTDDVMAHSELRKAYFSLLSAIFGGGMDAVLFSPKNVPHLQTILDSVPHYTSSENALAADQKMGLVVLNRFISQWLDPVQGGVSPQKVPHPHPQNGEANNGATSPRVPDFHRFVYEKIVPLCFSIPASRQFDWGDAQSYHVLQEMSNMLKTIYNARGQEFVSFMLSTLLPSTGCPPEPASALMQAIVSSNDGKQSRKPLVDFWDTARKSWRIGK